jgi:ferredoxin/flavodoxin---NADP+ reductase
MGPQGYATKPASDSSLEPIYEAWDPAAGKLLQGIYLAGWARKASTGLVGIARHDGENAAGMLLRYMESIPEKPMLCPDEIEAMIEMQGIHPVSKTDLQLLGWAEEREARSRNLNYFKYSDDHEMIKAIAAEKNAPKGHSLAVSEHDSQMLAG